jgi:hypothetical protein
MGFSTPEAGMKPIPAFGQLDIQSTEKYMFKKVSEGL